MSLPSEIKIPAWIKWIAQDENGSWWGFSVEPLEHSTGWYENEVGDYVLLLKFQGNNKHWRETLIKINS